MSNGLGERIRAQRQRLGLRQEDLAERARDYAEGRSIAVETVSRIEKGKNEPAAWMVQALARALETTADYILGLANTPDLPGEPRYPVPAADLAGLVVRLNELEPSERAQVRAIVESVLEFGKGSQRTVDVDNLRTQDWLQLVKQLSDEDYREIRSLVEERRKGQRAAPASKSA
jgi:transcriptional regulator with XRE-family HTH domain